MNKTFMKLILGISLATLSSVAIAHSYHEHDVKEEAKQEIQEMNQVLKLRLTREQFQKMWKATTEYKIYQLETSSEEDLDFYNKKYMDYMDNVLTKEQKSKLVPMELE